MRSRSNAAWLDAQYNNRARIPDHAQTFERWAARSRIARERPGSHLDLRYGEGPNENLDVFAPTGRATGLGPVLVFIHGGWWRALDKRDHSFIAPPFVESGTLVVVPNYALCPVVSIETIAMQMTRALAWVHRNAADFGGDPTRIVVAGHSAGGHLAAMLLCCDWRAVSRELPARLVKSALSISGVFDLEPLRQAPFLQCDLRLTPASVRRLSPAGFAPPRSPLVAVVGGGESEEFLRQNALIRAAWGKRAVPVCESMPGANHLEVLEQLADPASRLHAHAQKLLSDA